MTMLKSLLLIIVAILALGSADSLLAQDNLAPLFKLSLKDETFKSCIVYSLAQSKIPEKIRNISVSFEDDGIHVSGELKRPYWFGWVKIGVIIDVQTPEPNKVRLVCRKADYGALALKGFCGILTRVIQKRAQNTALPNYLKILHRRKVRNEEGKPYEVILGLNPGTMVPLIERAAISLVNVKKGLLEIHIGQAEPGFKRSERNEA